MRKTTFILDPTKLVFSQFADCHDKLPVSALDKSEQLEPKKGIKKTCPLPNTIYANKMVFLDKMFYLVNVAKYNKIKDNDSMYIAKVKTWRDGSTTIWLLHNKDIFTIHCSTNGLMKEG